MTIYQKQKVDSNEIQQINESEINTNMIQFIWHMG